MKTIVHVKITMMQKKMLFIHRTGREFIDGVREMRKFTHDFSVNSSKFD